MSAGSCNEKLTHLAFALESDTLSRVH